MENLKVGDKIKVVAPVDNKQHKIEKGKVYDAVVEDIEGYCVAVSIEELHIGYALTNKGSNPRGVGCAYLSWACCYQWQVVE